MFGGIVKDFWDMFRTTGREPLMVTDAPTSLQGVRRKATIQEGETAVRLQTQTRPLTNDCAVYIEPNKLGELQKAVHEAGQKGYQSISSGGRDIGSVTLQDYPLHGHESRCVVCDEVLVGRLETREGFADYAFVFRQDECIQRRTAHDRELRVDKSHVGVHYGCADDLSDMIIEVLDENVECLLGDAL